ncbi:uncharacterized protein LOC134909570 [Pseudophryne corroboree]|uniref:uncharacterized protein LOC134909570 n=1 Tax=Pseudophryne corroboree TaxID=495146 RepID=UPI0030819499
MQRPAAAIPIFDESHLFLPLTSNPSNPNMDYLQCPATGHIYCLATGSLYQVSTTIPLSTNIQPLLQSKQRYSPLLPSNPAPCTEQVSSINPVNNLDPTERCNTSSITPDGQGKNPPSIKSKSKKYHQCNPSAQSKIKSSTNPPSNSTPTTKNKKKHTKIIQDKPVPIQANPAAPKKESASAKWCNTSSITPDGLGKNPSSIKSKSKKSPQCNPSAQSKIKYSTNPPSNSTPTTKNKNKHTKIIQYKPVPIQANPAAPKKESASAKRCNTSSITTDGQGKNPPSIKSKSKKPPQCNPSAQSKIKSSTNPPSNSTPATKKKKNKKKHTKIIQDKPVPIQANPAAPIKKSASARRNKPTRSSKVKTSKSFKRKSGPKTSTTHPPITQIKLASHSKRHSTTIARRRRKPKLSIWSILVPFNRRKRPKKSLQRDKQEPVWSSQCKNCMMASSVHEIIHSRFTKNENERMPVSQLRAMLSSRHKKSKALQERIRRMEEEAIHKFKKLNLEKYKLKLKVEDKGLLSHPKKPWLVSLVRKVIDRSGKEGSWPLLVKCLYKHPDSTLRQASKHRSFCLTWIDPSYILRRDHAYYTQIQCHMAITETSYAELLVHTNKETTIVPVYFDNDFWVQTEATLDAFFTENVLPYFRKNNIEPNESRDSFKTEPNESRDSFKTEPNENRDSFKTEPNENRDLFKTEPNENRDSFETEPNENRDSFKTEPNEIRDSSESLETEGLIQVGSQ